MKYMKRAACLALSAALVASAGIVPLAQAAVPVSESVLEECNSMETPTVESVTALIAQIGDVTLKSGEKINAAATAYAQLDEESRALVPNVAVLIEAQQVFELEQALDQLYIKRDDVEGKTVIAPNKDLVNIRSATVLPCFIYSDNVGLSPLHIVAEYWGKRWVFFKQVIISMDGESYTKSFGSNEVLRDNADGYVWEWAEFNASAEEIEVLRKMAAAEKITIRFKGKERAYDIQMFKKGKQSILDTLHAYELMQNASDTVRAKALAGIR